MGKSDNSNCSEIPLTALLSSRAPMNIGAWRSQRLLRRPSTTLRTPRNDKSAGLTLIELLIVVAVIGLITTVLFMTMKPLQQLAKAKDAERKTDLNIISKALEDYINDHPCYPEVSMFAECGGYGFRPYLQKIPCDPETKQPYVYERPECQKYILYATLTTENLEINYNQKGNYVVSSPNLVIAPGQGGVGREEPPTSPPEATPTGISQNPVYACFNGECRLTTEDQCPNLNYRLSDCGGRCNEPQNQCH